MFIDVGVTIGAIHAGIGKVRLIDVGHVHDEHEIMAACQVGANRTLGWRGIIVGQRIISRRVVDESIGSHHDVTLVLSAGATDEQSISVNGKSQVDVFHFESAMGLM